LKAPVAAGSVPRRADPVDAEDSIAVLVHQVEADRLGPLRRRRVVEDVVAGVDRFVVGIQGEEDRVPVGGEVALVRECVVVKVEPALAVIGRNAAVAAVMDRVNAGAGGVDENIAVNVGLVVERRSTMMSGESSASTRSSMCPPG
jgi:hypothetical protein